MVLIDGRKVAPYLARDHKSIKKLLPPKARPFNSDMLEIEANDAVVERRNISGFGGSKNIFTNHFHTSLHKLRVVDGPLEIATSCA